MDGLGSLVLYPLIVNTLFSTYEGARISEVSREDATREGDSVYNHKCILQSLITFDLMHVQSSRITVCRFLQGNPRHRSFSRNLCSGASPPTGAPHRHERTSLLFVRATNGFMRVCGIQLETITANQINQRQMHSSTTADPTIRWTNLVASARMLQWRKPVYLVCQTLIERRGKYLYSPRQCHGPPSVGIDFSKAFAQIPCCLCPQIPY